MEKNFTSSEIQTNIYQEGEYVRDGIQQTKQFYSSSYERLGVNAQRRYPNEEFCRFLGSRWLSCTTVEGRAALRLLEVGSGSGANLWMAAREGFDTYGLELAQEGIEVCQEILDSWQVRATLNQGDMAILPYKNDFFDIVCDVFSAYCLPQAIFLQFLQETHRVLKPGGSFFFYTPSTRSDAFIRHEPSTLLDPYTLDGIKREDSPFYGNFYPWRFIDPDTIPDLIDSHGFSLDSLELVGRTYRSRAEYFEFVVCSAIKK